MLQLSASVLAAALQNVFGAFGNSLSIYLCVHMYMYTYKIYIFSLLLNLFHLFQLVQEHVEVSLS